MGNYLKRLIPLLLWEVIFILSCFIISEKYYIYTNSLFYFVIILYFIYLKEFNIKDAILNMKRGKKFWLPVTYTILGVIFAFVISIFVEIILPDVETGGFMLRASNAFEIILYAISTIIFPSIAEELFFRKAFIKFNKGNKVLVLTSLLGLLFYALEHSIYPFGIIKLTIIGTPLTIVYIRTKNIYIPILAHFIINLVGNGLDIIVSILYK